MRVLAGSAAVVVLALGGVPEAKSAPPAVAIHATPKRGPAPLAVVLTATGNAVTYRWASGDGAVAEGAVVQHTYARGGAYVATVTATAASGETAQARAVVVALEVSLAAPRVARYRSRRAFRGRVVPAEPRLAVT